jgi:hypothetical protein
VRTHRGTITQLPIGGVGSGVSGGGQQGPFGYAAMILPSLS